MLAVARITRQENQKTRVILREREKENYVTRELLRGRASVHAVSSTHWFAFQSTCRGYPAAVQ